MWLQGSVPPGLWGCSLAGAEPRNTKSQRGPQSRGKRRKRCSLDCQSLGPSLPDLLTLPVTCPEFPLIPWPSIPPSCFPSHSAEGLQLWGLSFLPWPLQAGWEQWGHVSVVQVNTGLNMWVWWCPVSREGSAWKCWGWGQTGRVPARRIAHSLWNHSAELHRAGAEAGGSAAGGVSRGLLPSQLTHPGVLLQ